MGKWKFFGFSLAVALAAVLTTSLMPAMSQGGERFVLCERNGDKDYGRDIDNEPEGESPGDEFLFSEPEYNQNGKRVGTVYGKGTFIRALGKRDGVIFVEASVNLQDGRIQVQGALKFSNFRKVVTVPIVGGSGRYTGAGGTISIEERVGCGGFPKADKLTYELR